jgi:hypothetical protein
MPIPNPKNHVLQGMSLAMAGGLRNFTSKPQRSETLISSEKKESKIRGKVSKDLMLSALALKLFGAGRSIRIERRKEMQIKIPCRREFEALRAFPNFFRRLQVTSVLK